MKKKFDCVVMPRSLAKKQWDDWRWQMQNAVRSASELPFDGDDASNQNLPVLITPYYLEVLKQLDGAAGLRRTVVPSVHECESGAEELDDPLGEQAHQATSCVVHTYPDKVLFLASDCCAVHCRYCTRSRWIGRGRCSDDDWNEGLNYIQSNPAIRDVLISGGDPLMLSDARLEWLLGALRTIDHVELIRIGTKVPAALPQRITNELVALFRKYGVWLVIHFIHPAELTACCADVCIRLADAGIPLASQTVLLKGVNNSSQVLKELMEGLLRMKVRPYYLLQCDPVRGSSHFRTSILSGQQIIREMHGHTTGLAVPMYMVDAPGGGGKVPVGPSYVDQYDGKYWHLKDCAGGVSRYYDPDSPSVVES